MPEDVPLRPPVTVTRSHQRFLLRQLHFSQQFAQMYYERLNILKPRALQRYKAAQLYTHEPDVGCEYRRVLELEPGQPSYCVGTLFKHMKAYTRFLDEYQKELVRIELGEGDGDGDGDGDGEMGGLDDVEAGGLEEVLDHAADAPINRLRSDNFCSAADVLHLEDDSGRVELSSVDTTRYTTGMVVVVTGVLREKGKFEVSKILFAGPSPQALVFPPQRPLVAAPPVYVAFVCGLSVGYNGTAAASLDLLADFVGGNFGDDGVVELASRISRLVIGGNSIDVCDELRLKYKVKLDPSDHVRVTDTSSVNTSANCMRELDRVLTVLAETVDVDVMPGETDPSNSFVPQQPLHPILLPNATKRSTLRLVTNPYEFCVKAVGAEHRYAEGSLGARIFVTSGCNIEDILKQTSFASPVDAMAATVECGCSCPTAPNSLVCYPFKDSDPFLYPSTPHVVLACNQDEFGTTMQVTTTSAGEHVACRLVSVPSFAKTGSIVLVNVADPNFSTTLFQLQ